MMRQTLLQTVMTRLAGAAAIGLLTLGVFGSTQALAGIANTKHNLGTSANAGTSANVFSGTAEICVFCHTPHGSDISAAVPLWNRTLADPTTYTSYNSLGTSSLDGATAPVGSVSIACLSCHDGAQAMNTIINAPGSGTVGDTAFTTGTWSGTGGLTGKPVGIALIGTELRDDHPIGIQYAGGPTAGTVPAAPAAYGNTLFRDADFKGAVSAVINGQSVWWVDTSAGTDGTRQKTDMQLYTRTASTSLTTAGAATAGTLTGAQPFVECASCHDPHVENVANSNPTFLRIANTGSAVCLACHIK